MARINLAPRGGGVGLGRAPGVSPAYLLPWLLAVGLAALAVLIRFGLASDQAWYWSTFTAAIYGALTWVTWRASRPRGVLTCRLATGGVAAAGLWSWWIAGVDELTWRPFALYAGLALVTCLGANIVVAFRGHVGEGSGGSMLDQLGGALAKLRNVNEITAQSGQVRARYEMEPGTPAAELQSAAPALASALGLPPDGVRVLPSKDDASEGELRLSPTNPLAKPPVWPGPSIRSGGTLMDPIVTGVRRGGQPLQHWLPGDPEAGRNASLCQVTGMSGGGKTIWLRYLIIEVLSRGGPEEVEYWYGNSRKADQEPAWVREGAARFENTRKGVAQMLRDLREEAPERARFLGAQGLDQWRPGCGIPFRVVICDEFADIATDVERIFVDLAETVRSLGVHLVCGFQRASGSRMPTDARSNFGTHACFGVRDETDAEMALPEDVLDAGAAPWLWTNKAPGMCYLTAPGVDEDLWVEPARTFRPDDARMEKWAMYYINQRRAAADPTASTALVSVPAAPAVRERAERVDGGGDSLMDAVDVDMAAAADVEEADQADDRDGELLDIDAVDEGEAYAATAELLEAVAADLGDDGLAGLDDDVERHKVPADVAGEVMQLDPRQPIESHGGGGMRLALSPQMTPAEGRQHVRGYLAEVHAAGVTLVKREDLGDLLADVGRGSRWLSKVLGEFCDEQKPPWLKRTDERGWYEILAAPGSERDGAQS